jgi:hypothetical protein
VPRKPEESIATDGLCVTYLTVRLLLLVLLARAARTDNNQMQNERKKSSANAKLFSRWAGGLTCTVSTDMRNVTSAQLQTPNRNFSHSFLEIFPDPLNESCIWHFCHVIFFTVLVGGTSAITENCMVLQAISQHKTACFVISDNNYCDNVQLVPTLPTVKSD